MFFKKRARRFGRPTAGDSSRLTDVWTPGYLLALQITVVAVLLGFAGWFHVRDNSLFGDRRAEPEEVLLKPLDVLSSSDIARSLAVLAEFRELSWVETQAYNSRTLTADVGGLPVVAKPAVINSTIRTRHDILQYVVSPGDNVFSLANYFNVSAASIRLSNGLESNSLEVGETILIPPSGLNGIAYLVEEGDTLTTLTNAYNFSPAAMLSFNDLEADEALPTGEFVFLPQANLVALQDVPDFVTQAVISDEQRDEDSLFDIDRACVGCGIVRAGESIGTVGNTGWSTGPHLHIEVITYDGRRHNPWSFINQNRLVWPVDQAQRRISQVFHSGHRGLDIADHEGTPVLAVADGDIIHRGCLWSASSIWSTFGVIIDHGSYYSLSIHLQAPNNPDYAACSINRRSQYGQKSIDYSIEE